MTRDNEPTTQPAGLKECRDAIERIDGEFVALLLKRVEIARKTGKLKRDGGLPILDPQREAQVIRSAVERARELGLDDEPVRGIFWHILGMSRKAQQAGDK